MPLLQTSGSAFPRSAQADLELDAAEVEAAGHVGDCHVVGIDHADQLGDRRRLADHAQTNILILLDWTARVRGAAIGAVQAHFRAAHARLRQSQLWKNISSDAPLPCGDGTCVGGAQKCDARKRGGPSFTPSEVAPWPFTKNKLVM